MNGITAVWIPAGIKRVLKNAYWRIYGAFLTNPPVPVSPCSFLFICKGNICRSPFAEVAARKHLPDADKWVVRSAGLLVDRPHGSPPEAVSAAKTFEIDLAGHRSKRVDEDLVAAADMVFAMEAWHFRRLHETFPKHREKIFLLAPFEDPAPVQRDRYGVLNIQDPYGRTRKDFIGCFERIDACLRGLFSRIQTQEDHRLRLQTTLVEEIVR